MSEAGKGQKIASNFAPILKMFNSNNKKIKCFLRQTILSDNSHIFLALYELEEDGRKKGGNTTRPLHSAFFIINF